MMQRFFLMVVLPVMVIILPTGCKYNKGEMYTSTIPVDSLQYIILASGSGSKISKKASYLKLQHEYKGNVCTIKYLSDSSSLDAHKSILLFNTDLPDLDNDLLTKGFFGTFTSKQYTIYLIVSDQDFDRYFRKTEL